MSDRGLFRDRLIDLSDAAMRELSWSDLAAYVDALNEEYQWFLTQINERTIGVHVPKAARPTRTEGAENE